MYKFSQGQREELERADNCDKKENREKKREVNALQLSAGERLEVAISDVLFLQNPTNESNFPIQNKCLETLLCLYFGVNKLIFGQTLLIL